MARALVAALAWAAIAAVFLAVVKLTGRRPLDLTNASRRNRP